MYILNETFNLLTQKKDTIAKTVLTLKSFVLSSLNQIMNYQPELAIKTFANCLK